MILKRLSIISFIILALVSCSANKGVVTKKSKSKKTEAVKVDKPIKEQKQVVKNTETIEITVVDTPEVYNSPTEEYIAIYSDIAQEEMRQYGIPASITLAQGILESGSGKGRLAVEANNHFGVKCHEWTGAKIYHDDDEKGECFRKYKNSKYSFQDHSVFLSTRKRYHKLFILEKDDYKGWARELRAAGYATDRKYPDKLISLIERYQLFRFDAEVLGKDEDRKDKHIVVSGDTLYSISKKHKISIDELKMLNGLDSDNLFVGQILFVKPLPKDF